MEGQGVCMFRDTTALVWGFFFINKIINTCNLVALIDRMHADFLCYGFITKFEYHYNTELQV